MARTDDLLSIGELSARSDVAPSALRFYEAERLIESTRTSGGQRRFRREMLRRVSFIRIAQRVGLNLDEIRDSLASLPRSRTPTKADWARLSRAWRPRLDEHVAMLQRLRDQLDECIGCGCLSLRTCALYNRDDRAAAFGPGPRYLLADVRPAADAGRAVAAVPAGAESLRSGDG